MGSSNEKNEGKLKTDSLEDKVIAVD